MTFVSEFFRLDLVIFSLYLHCLCHSHGVGYRLPLSGRYDLCIDITHDIGHIDGRDDVDSRAKRVLLYEISKKEW